MRDPFLDSSYLFFKGRPKTPKVRQTFGVHFKLNGLIAMTSDLCRKETFFDEFLCNLNCVGRGSLAEIVGNAPEVEARLH